MINIWFIRFFYFTLQICFSTRNVKPIILSVVSFSSNKSVHMRKLLLSIAFIICFCSLVYGQRGADASAMSGLTVTVTEAGSGKPVQMATVYLVQPGDTLATTFSFTDKRGVASLKNFAAGKYVVNVQLLGFKPYMKEMTLAPRTVHQLSVALEEDLEELEGASITEMGDLVTMKGDTLIYNATSFHTTSDASLGDLLKKMPGIEVSDGRVKVNGEPVKRITVEGKTFFFDDQSKALENLPAIIVNKIKVIDKENHGRFGLSKKEKEMDVRLKDEYREAWFGRASAEGGVSVKGKESERFGDDTHGLYNAKLYAQFYGKNDDATIIGGGNNINANQLARTSAGLSNVASFGTNYNTSRIIGYGTNASASYDFRNGNNSSESHRTSFLSSGEQLETNRSQKSNDISNSAKAGFSIGTELFEHYHTEGFVISGNFRYNRMKTANESSSSTNNSAGDELNGSESHTSGTSDDFAANVNLKAKYFLDNEFKNRISFGGSIGYNGTRGNSRESSVTRFGESEDVRGLHYTDRLDGLRLNASVVYCSRLSRSWNINSAVSLDFDSSKDNRDAVNAEDYSRNDYYSRYSRDRNFGLKQSVYASYGIDFGEQKHFDTNFGLCVYEDNISRFSEAFGAVENRNDRWQVNAGPDVRLGFRSSSIHCVLNTSGKSTAPPKGAAGSTMLDISDPTDVSTGNIYLKTGYHQDIRLSVMHGSRGAGSRLVDIRIVGSIDLNELTRASWYDLSAVRYSIPVNAKHPRYNASLNITYVQPLDKKKSLNLTFTPKASFSAGTIYVSDGPLNGIDKETFDYTDLMKWFYGDKNGSEFYSGRSGFIENRIHNLNWSLNMDLKYEIRDYSIKGGASVLNTVTGYSASEEAKVNNWRYGAYAEVLWQNRKGWEAECRFDFRGYSGFSSGYNRPDYLLNLKIAKAVKSFTIRLSAYDILGSSRAFTHTSSAEYVEDTYRNNIGRCILVGLSYSFGKWNFAKRLKAESIEKRNNL